MDEIAQEYKNQKEDKFGNFLSNINLGTIIVFGIIVFILIYISTKKNIDPRYHYILYFLLIGIIVYLWFRPNSGKVLLEWDAAAKIAQKKLNEMKSSGIFKQDSVVRLTPYSHLVFDNNLATGFGDYVSWDIGYEELVHGTQYKKEGIIKVHPYKGILIGLSAMPLGYDGRQTKDKEIYPVGVIMGTQKTTDIVGPTK